VPSVPGQVRPPSRGSRAHASRVRRCAP
jgi:hypothetical protein